jgi:hypothetical protein
MGDSGAGKTTQFLTLPGKKFAYLFDPSALSALRGHDVEFEMFVPTVVSLAAQSLSKGKGDQKKLSMVDASKVYLNWEADFEKKVTEGYWADIDCILFDSFTTFSQVVMDRILEINGRTGQWPQQDDWTAQMNTMINVVRTLTGQMGMTLVCTGHEQTVQDEMTHRIQNQIILTGQLKSRLPLLFSDILHMECQVTNGEAKYVAQTKPDRMNPKCRTSFRGLDQFHDVTIKDWNNPENYGLGKLLKDNNLT